MRRVLIDTHTFLWFIDDDPRLSTSAKRILEDEAPVIFLSMMRVQGSDEIVLNT